MAKQSQSPTLQRLSLKLKNIMDMLDTPVNEARESHQRSKSSVDKSSLGILSESFLSKEQFAPEEAVESIIKPVEESRLPSMYWKRTEVTQSFDYDSCDLSKTGFEETLRGQSEVVSFNKEEIIGRSTSIENVASKLNKSVRQEEENPWENFSCHANNSTLSKMPNEPQGAVLAETFAANDIKDPFVTPDEFADARNSFRISMQSERRSSSSSHEDQSTSLSLMDDFFRQRSAPLGTLEGNSSVFRPSFGSMRSSVSEPDKEKNLNTATILRAPGCDAKKNESSVTGKENKMPDVSQISSSGSDQVPSKLPVNTTAVTIDSTLPSENGSVNLSTIDRWLASTTLSRSPNSVVQGILDMQQRKRQQMSNTQASNEVKPLSSDNVSIMSQTRSSNVSSFLGKREHSGKKTESDREEKADSSMQEEHDLPGLFTSTPLHSATNSQAKFTSTGLNSSLNRLSVAHSKSNGSAISEDFFTPLLKFDGMTVAGMTTPVNIGVTNSSRHWLQYSVKMFSVAINGAIYLQKMDDLVKLELKHMVILEPNKTEDLEITLTPKVVGNIKIMLHVHARDIMTKSAVDGGKVEVTLDVEVPRLIVKLPEDNCLNFGLLPEGCTLPLAVLVGKRGKAALLLEMHIHRVESSDNCFSFSQEQSEGVTYLTRTSAQCHLLPERESKLVPVSIECHAPTLSSDIVEPLAIQGILSISLGTDDKSQKVLEEVRMIVRIGRVGLRLISPGVPLVLKSTPGGSSITPIVIQNKGGNIPLHVSARVKHHSDVFLLHPHKMEIKPNHESSLHVGFRGPEDGLHVEDTLVVSVHPIGPEKELWLQGEVISPPSSIQTADSVTSSVSSEFQEGSSSSLGSCDATPTNKVLPQSIPCASTGTAIVPPPWTFNSQTSSTQSSHATPRVMMSTNSRPTFLTTQGATQSRPPPGLAASQSKLTWGCVAIGKSALQTVKIKNMSGIEKFTLRVLLEGDAFKLQYNSSVMTPFVLEPQDSYELPVSFSPSSVGPHNGCVIVRARSQPSQNVRKFMISLSGVGGCSKIHLEQVNQDANEGHVATMELWEGQDCYGTSILVRNRGNLTAFITMIPEDPSSITVSPPWLLVAPESQYWVTLVSTCSLQTVYPGSVLARLRIVSTEEINRARYCRTLSVMDARKSSSHVPHPVLAGIDLTNPQSQEDVRMLPSHPQDLKIFRSSLHFLMISLRAASGEDEVTLPSEETLGATILDACR